MKQNIDPSQSQDASAELNAALQQEEGPITIKGGSVELKFKKNELPVEPNDPDKHFNAKKQLTRLFVNGTLVKTLDKNDKIEIYYKAIS